nr:hypothetical protein [Tanacetum cinerariifolium]
EASVGVMGFGGKVGYELFGFSAVAGEFFGELTHIDLIPPRINEADFEPEEEICLVEKLLIVTLLWRRSILTPDDSMPPGIENDDYDSERHIIFLEELLMNDSPSLPENESFHFDVPSSICPPAKPPDDDEIEPDTGLLTTKVDDGNKMHKAFPLPVTEFPLPEELPTAREDSCHCQKKREAIARKIALLSMSRSNCQSKVAVTLNTTTTDTTSGETGTKSGRTVTLTDEDMQKKKNDVKERTTLLISLLDEHQLRFRNLRVFKTEGP